MTVQEKQQKVQDALNDAKAFFKAGNEHYEVYHRITDKYSEFKPRLISNIVGTAESEVMDND